MAESFSVKAILSAVDKGFTSTFSKAERLVERIASRCEKSTSSTAQLTSGFKSMAAAIGVTQAVSAAFDLLSGSIDSAVSRYDTLNRFPKVLQQIGFTAEDSQKSMDELSKGIQGLPTTLDDVVITTQRLAAMTGDLDKATKTTLALNDAFIASGSSSEDASRGLDQYVQMLAKGQVDLESWRSLQETMSVALNDVAKAFGFAGASAQNDLYEALKEGQITFDEFNAKLIELDGGVNGFAARAKTASGGIATAFTNMRTAVTRGVTGIIESVDKALQANGLPRIEEIVNDIGSVAETALGKVSSFINIFAEAGNAASKLEALRNTVEPLVPLLSFLGSGAALGGILPAIGRTRNGMESLMDSADNAAGKIGKAKDTTILFGKAMSGSLAPGTEEFKNLGIESQRLVERVSGVKSVLSGSMDFESKGFKNLSKDTQNFLLQVDGMNQKFRGVMDGVNQKVKGVASTLKSFGQSAVSMIPDSLLGRINGIKDGISGLASGITGKVSSLVSGVTGQFSKLTSFIPDSVKNIASGVGNGFKNIASVIGNSLKGSAQVGVAALQNMIKALSVVFKAALLSVGPAAILGLVVVGLGLVNQQFGQQINQLLTIAQQQGPQIITNLVAGIVNQIPQLASTGSMLLSQILATIASLLPSITTAGINILNALISGITGNMDILLQGVISLVGAIASSIIQLAPQIMLAGLNILMSLTQGILDNMPVLLTGIQSLFDQLTSSISTWLPVMITYGIQILNNLADGIVQALPTLILCAIQLMTEFVSTISQNYGKMLDSAAEIVGKLVSGIRNHLPEILSAAINLVMTILEGIADNLPKILQAGVEIVGSLASGVIKAIPDILSAALELIGRLKDQFFETDWLSIGVNIISGIAKGISNAAGQLWSAAKAALGNFKDKVLGFFGIHSPSRWGKYVGKMLDYGIAGGLSGYVSKIANGAQKVMDSIADTFEGGNGIVDIGAAFAGETPVNMSYTVNVNDGELSSKDISYTRNAKYTIVVPVQIDGKETARVTAPFTEAELNKRQKVNNMINGIR